MRKLSLVLAFLTAAPLQAQVSQAKYDSLAARVTVLEQMIGTQYLGKSSSELAASLTPEHTVLGGRYPLFLSDYQIRVGLAEGFSGLQAKIGSLGEHPTVQSYVNAAIASIQPPPPAASQPPSGGISLPLTSTATAVRDMRDLNAERDAGHRVTFNAAALRREATVHHGDHAFVGKVAVGSDHVLDVDPSLQVRAGGEILFHSVVAPENTQEYRLGGPYVSRTRLGAVSFNAYDNGIRFIRGAVWRNGIMQHNPDDPRVQILAMDSQGTVSKSVEDYSQGTVERSQLWIIQEDFEARKIRLIPTRAGWGAEICASTTTTNHRAGELGRAHLFLDRCVPLINALPNSQ